MEVPGAKSALVLPGRCPVGGSFNYYARKVRNSNLPLSVRASALNSCVREFSAILPGRPYLFTLKRLSQFAGIDQIRQTVEVEHLLSSLQRIESVRNQILELNRAFERKRIRQKCRGRRVPSKAERMVLSEAITAVRGAADMLPDQRSDSSRPS